MHGPGSNVVESNVVEYLGGLSLLPWAHARYLERLKHEGFEPKVIFDIGACVGNWAMHARRLWPDATLVLFDANPAVEGVLCRYGDVHIDVLTESDDKRVTFYIDSRSPGLSRTLSRTLNDTTEAARTGQTLDTIVARRGFPAPDLVKIDVQGAELDVVVGGAVTIGSAHLVIVELRESDAETRAAVEALGFRCTAERFCSTGSDSADYGFTTTPAGHFF
jgi:FkbM family methyltransferase